MSIADVMADDVTLRGAVRVSIDPAIGMDRHSKPLAALDPQTDAIALPRHSNLIFWRELDHAIQAGRTAMVAMSFSIWGPEIAIRRISQNWPDGSPNHTPHALATLMISISDNSATDT